MASNDLMKQDCHKIGTEIGTEIRTEIWNRNRNQNRNRKEKDQKQKKRIKTHLDHPDHLRKQLRNYETSMA